MIAQCGKERERESEDTERGSLSFWSIGSASFSNAKVALKQHTHTLTLSEKMQAWNHSFKSSSPPSSSSKVFLFVLLLLHTLLLDSLTLATALLCSHGVDRSQHHRGRWNTIVWFHHRFCFITLSLWNKHFSISFTFRSLSSFFFCVLGAMARLCRPYDLSAEERKRCCVLATGTLWASSGFSCHCL